MTVRVNAELPIVALAGESAVIEGAGLLAVIVKLCAFEVPPPGAGVNTVTLALPALVSSAAEIGAVSWEALT